LPLHRSSHGAPAKPSKACLLDLGFFVDHMLANDGIEFLDFHLIGHSALVLICRVKVTSLGAGH
jgi:hypothetical protein